MYQTLLTYNCGKGYAELFVHLTIKMSDFKPL